MLVFMTFTMIHPKNYICENWPNFVLSLVVYICVHLCICVCVCVFTGHFRNLVRLPGRQAGVYSIDSNMSVSDETSPGIFRPQLDMVDTAHRVSLRILVQLLSSA